jgi:hypothetical protein
MLQRVHRVLRGRSTSDCYLYLSRHSTALPSIRGLGIREVRWAWTQTPSGSIRQILKYHNLSDPILISELINSGLKDIDSGVENWWQDQRIHFLLEESRFQKAVESQAAKARAILRAYLAQEQFFSAKCVALVDIGWRGSIQDNLMWAYEEDPDCPEVRGFYFGLGPLAYQDDESNRWRNQKEGLIGDWRGYPQVRARALFFFLEIFEQAARAEHGTTIGYEQREDQIVAILKESGPDRQAEQLSQPAIEALQYGIDAFTSSYRTWLSRFGGDLSTARKEVWRRIDRLVFAPTVEELKAISELTHSDDGGFDSYRRLVQKKTPSLLFSPSHWLEQFHRAPWKPSVLRHTGGPLLARLYREYIRLKPVSR